VGAGRATTKYVAEALGRGERERAGAVTWTTTAVQLALGVAVAAVLLRAAPALGRSLFRVPAALESEAALAFALIAATIPAVLIGSCFRGVLEAAQRFDLVNAIRLPASLANYLLPLVGLALGWRLRGILSLLLAFRVAAAGAFLLAVGRVLPELWCRTRSWRGELRRVVGYGGWSTVSSVVSPLLVYLDRFVLGALAGAAAVAYYAVPFELALRLLVVPASLAATLFPAFSALDGRREDARTARLSGRALKFILCVLGPVALVLVVGARDLLELWLGPTYAREGATALRLLAAAIVVNAVAHVPYALLQGRGRPDLPAKFHLAELPVQLGATWLLVSRFGVAGAAGAWLLRVSLDAGLLLVAASATGGLSPRHLLAERIPHTAALLTALAAPAAAAVAWAPTQGVRLVVLALAAVATAALAWRVSLSAGDRDDVLRWLRARGA
ncbi:MAG: oligosaccharide flippase family protein, partial [Gemmatimonadetes bacterium]|nr:oligosaccharide flippase family protein [Gemmatimonadota bacterium]